MEPKAPKACGFLAGIVASRYLTSPSVYIHIYIYIYICIKRHVGSS